MHKYYPEQDDRRLKMIDNYGFVDFEERLILDIEENPSTSRFNKMCEGAYPEY